MDPTLQSFFQIHDFMVEHAHVPIRRMLMDEINWADRLIGLQGGRGVGKTDFLLARARDIEAALCREQGREHVRNLKERPCLYINCNDFYFTEHTLLDFAGMFVKAGGKYLLVDNIFKYDGWSKELRKCYSRYRDLHIVFSASPVMAVTEENRDLSTVVKMYNLRGFSFREYLNLQARRNFRTYTLEEIMSNHVAIAQEITEMITPADYFCDYLHHGYYPSYLENTNFDAELLKTMNMMLEVDVLMIRQIDVACLPKLRKLLYLILSQAPCSLNVSSLADAIGLSRATTMNYIKYLKDARLLNMLYIEDKHFPMKPVKVYAQNTNIMHLVTTRQTEWQDLCETYFYNTLHTCHKVNATERNAMFVIDGTHYFDVKAEPPKRESIRPCAVGSLEVGKGNLVPLWLLGFLY